MVTLNYETARYRRRLVCSDERLIEAVYTPREGIETGMVFLGRVEAYHATMRGYFVDLGERRKGLFQGQERLEVGKHYLFEVRKTAPNKHPILSRRIGFVGHYVIYQPGRPTKVSDKINAPMQQQLLAQGLEHVYFRSIAADTSFFRVEAEYQELKAIYAKALQSEAGERYARLIYRPPVPELNVSESERLEFEEELVRLRQGTIIDDDITYHLDVTRIGLVIDVNSGRSKSSPEQINNQAMAFISQLMIRMNVGGLVIVDLIGSGRQARLPDLMQLDPRVRHVGISKLGLLEITRKRIGISMYDIPLLEVMADYIHFRLEIELAAGRTIRGIQISRRYQGIEEYLSDLQVEYNEVFGYFQFF